MIYWQMKSLGCSNINAMVMRFVVASHPCSKINTQLIAIVLCRVQAHLSSISRICLARNAQVFVFEKEKPKQWWDSGGKSIWYSSGSHTAHRTLSFSVQFLQKGATKPLFNENIHDDNELQRKTKRGHIHRWFE